MKHLQLNLAMRMNYRSLHIRCRATAKFPSQITHAQKHCETMYLKLAQLKLKHDLQFALLKNALHQLLLAHLHLKNLHELNEKHPNVQSLAAVLVLTAFSQRDLVEEARDAGALAYLVKPFQERDLVPAIEVALARQAERVALEVEVADLKERLETRKLTDRAKGVLMDDHGLSEAEAWRYLQTAAMNGRTGIATVARAVIAGDLAPVAPGPD